MPQAVHVDRDELSRAEVVELDTQPLPDGAVRLKIESFAVTANNITYAVIGDRFGYWNFFPAESGPDRNWGIVPMWGHAVVEESAHDGFKTGERVYGYLPMATHLIVLPGKVTKHSFIDSAPHRQPMSPIYNQYSRLGADPEHNPDKERERMIFGPLFKTGFLIESMFRRERWNGAEAVIVTSASSKTAMGLASVAKDRSPDIRRIGLTSPGNVSFVEQTGLYDQVHSYDDVGKLDNHASVSVDFAGSAEVLRNIHEKLGDALKYSCLVGATHIEARNSGDAKLSGPEPILFFAPDHAVAAVKELGPQEFGRQIAESWSNFLDEVDGTVDMDVRHGIDAAHHAYLTMLAGDVDPARGVVIVL